jgi:predicted metal-binding membrane protein
MRAASDERLLLPVLVGMIALAWVALVIWGYSPYSAYLSHDQLEGSNFLPGSVLGILVVGWTLMTVAMMLPTALPLITMFRRMTLRRADNTRLVGLLILGYLMVWALFGLAVHVLDLGIHTLVDAHASVARNVWAFSAGTLLAAGVFQFSRLKYHCLDKCRSPMSFIVGHWSGGSPSRQAFSIGAHHGIFCVGCCWALMLLMFAVGMGNVAWMLLLGVVMAVEKNLPWGRRISHPLGVVLLALGSLLVVAELLA